MFLRVTGVFTVWNAFRPDGVILFSDILTVPDAMGLGLRFETGEGPKFERPVRDEAGVEALPGIVPEEQLGYVMDAVRTIRRELDGRVPLIGFSGSPWTLATYMVEGGSTKNFSLSKGMMFEKPALMHALLDKLAESVTLYLNAQIAAGAQAVMLFDTWGGVLTPNDYREFSLGYMQRIIAGLTREHDGRRVPCILFTKGGSLWLDAMADAGPDALGLDWTIDIGEARRQVGDRVALQGNMDPCVLYSSPERIEKEVQKILAGFGKGPGHVFNLGHGIHPEIPPEHAAAMIEAVHRHSREYHL